MLIKLFLLKGVIETADQAVVTTENIIKLFAEDRKKIETLGRPAASALIVHQYPQQHIVSDIKKIATYCDVTIPTITKSINNLVKSGIAKEISGKERNKVYVYKKYLDILNDGAGTLK